jgi:BRCT domain type II-containing protein
LYVAAKAKKAVEDKVKEYGGLIASALNKKCTMLVLSEKDAGT